MLKRPLVFTASIIGAILVLAFAKFDGPRGLEQKEPWTPSQLISPDDLAATLKEDPSSVHVFDIGPAGQIKHAVHIGAGRNPENVRALEQAVVDLPKDADIVLYCGCCPFKDCPNIRPTFRLLNDLEFTNHKLLDIENNLKVDWIDRGYPME